MFRSLFIKYLSVFILTIFVSFLILTSVVTSFIGAHADSDRYSVLQSAAGAMSVYIRNDFDDGEKSFSSYSGTFKEASGFLSSDTAECALFLTDKNGVVCSFGVTNGENIFSADETGDVKIPEEYISETADGNIVSGDGTMGGIFSDDSLFVGVPVQLGGEYAGAVFAQTDNNQFAPITEIMIKTLVMSSIWVMIASLIAIYVISKRLTKPLKEMSKAAADFSKGNFNCRIVARGNDEIAELARAFNTMSESLGNLESMRSSFVSSVSHELRTPMTSIGGFIDSILEGAIPQEEQKKYLEIVSSEVKRLSRLVNSLLQISRLESGNAKLNPVEFDICEMARMILISNEQRIDERNLDVEFESDEDNITVIADEDFIHQVLFNLCDNAIKFSEPGGKYKIGVKKIDKKRVAVSVYNEGSGISAEDLPYVFDRFYKSDKSRGLDKRGVGLGLYIVKCIIDNHGQDIKAESEYGKWCRFTFTLALK